MCGARINNQAVSCAECGTAQLLDPSPLLQSPAEAAEFKYAGFWTRLLAWLIDAAILGTGGAMISSLIGGLVGGALMVTGDDITKIIFVNVIIGFVIGFILDWLYHTIGESSARRTTIGKKALGLIVVNTNGSRMSFLRANGRYWGKILSGLLIGIGYLMVGFTARKQGLHDMMAGTIVIRNP
jgi:uncharacterized RDD family membrane protein YckC